jgi:hypothetical protein
LQISSLVSAAIARVTAAIAAAGTLQGASPVKRAPVQLAIGQSLYDLEQEAIRLDALIDETTVGGVVAGVPAPVLVTTFNAQMLVVQQLAAVQTARGYVARMLVNVTNAPG